MRNVILGTIGVLWGGGMIISGLGNAASSESGAYAAGSLTASVFGAALLAAGSWTLIKRFRRNDVAARPAVDQAQPVPVRAGVRGVALSRRRSRSRSSQELVRCSRVSDLVECALRASSE